MKFITACLISIIFVFSFFTGNADELIQLNLPVQITQEQHESIDIDKVVKGAIWGVDVVEVATDSDLPLPIAPIIVAQERFNEETTPSQIEQLERYFMELFRGQSKEKVKNKSFWNKDFLLGE